jgi:hypothetical protein
LLIPGAVCAISRNRVVIDREWVTAGRVLLEDAASS